MLGVIRPLHAERQVVDGGVDSGALEADVNEDGLVDDGHDEMRALETSVVGN